MSILQRLRYLLAEGFEVSAISGYDSTGSSDIEPGHARITYVRIADDGARKLCSEDFEATGGEMEECSKLFLESL